MFSGFSHLNMEQLGSLCTTLWTIWKQRNATIWSGHNLPPMAATQQGREFVRAWRWARTDHPADNHTHPSTLTRWSRPATSTLKCNVDGAIFKDSLQMGIRCVIQIENGNHVQAHTCCMVALSLRKWRSYVCEVL